MINGFGVISIVVAFVCTLVLSLFFFAAKFMSVDFSESLDGDLIDEEEQER